jgi:hypothetical protein
MNTLTTTDNTILVKAELSKSFPIVAVFRYTLGGEERASIGINVSMDEKQTWSNGIFENSRHAKFMLNSDGKLELLCKNRTAKFRAGKVKDINHAIARIREWKEKEV